MNNNHFQTPRTHREIEQLVVDTLKSLNSACQNYDQGHYGEAGTIATQIYKLIHDASKNQPSGLTLLGIDKQSAISFLESGVPLNPRNLMSEFPLAMILIGDPTKTGFVPTLKSMGEGNYIRFNKWWETPIIKTYDKHTYTRKQLVFAFRHEKGSHLSKNYGSQGGISGSHYAELERGNSTGLVYESNGQKYQLKYGPQYATIRQIAWEVLQTFQQYLPHLIKQSEMHEENLIPITS